MRDVQIVHIRNGTRWSGHQVVVTEAAPGPTHCKECGAGFDVEVGEPDAGGARQLRVERGKKRDA